MSAERWPMTYGFSKTCAKCGHTTTMGLSAERRESGKWGLDEGTRANLFMTCECGAPLYPEVTPALTEMWQALERALKNDGARD